MTFRLIRLSKTESNSEMLIAEYDVFSVQYKHDIVVLITLFGIILYKSRY